MYVCVFTQDNYMQIPKFQLKIYFWVITYCIGLLPAINSLHIHPRLSSQKMKHTIILL